MHPLTNPAIAASPSKGLAGVPRKMRRANRIMNPVITPKRFWALGTISRIQRGPINMNNQVSSKAFVKIRSARSLSWSKSVLGSNADSSVGFRLNSVILKRWQNKQWSHGRSALGSTYVRSSLASRYLCSGSLTAFRYWWNQFWTLSTSSFETLDSSQLVSRCRGVCLNTDS